MYFLLSDTDGLARFAFHGKINEEIGRGEAGTISNETLRAKHNRWTVIDKSVRLEPGDVIYYGTYVQYHNGETLYGYSSRDLHKFYVHGTF